MTVSWTYTCESLSHTTGASLYFQLFHVETTTASTRVYVRKMAAETSTVNVLRDSLEITASLILTVSASNVLGHSLLLDRMV